MLRTPLRDAAVLLGASVAVGLAFNFLRPSGLPLVASRPYAIFAPCPETRGEVEAVEAGDERISDGTTLIVDARSEEAFAAWHLPSAMNVPYDFLEAVGEDELERVARSGAKRVVVYGDGEDPDSGRELAREIAGKGIRNVMVVVGGAPALRHAEEAR